MFFFVRSLLLLLLLPFRRPPPPISAHRLSEQYKRHPPTHKKNSRLAWASFWSQLALSTVSAVVLFFTAAQSRPTWAAQGGVLPLPFPFLCTAVGVAGALVSTALAFGLTRVTRAVIVRGDSVKRSAVVAGALAATRLNLWSTGAALVGLQATVGSLVSSTLLTATTNPFVLAQNAGNAAARAPVALDVFAVQASANVLGSHFVSLIFATILIRTLARAPPSRGPPRRRSRRDEEEYEFSLPASSSSSAAPPAAAAKSAFESAQDFKKGAY